LAPQMVGRQAATRTVARESAESFSISAASSIRADTASIVETVQAVKTVEEVTDSATAILNGLKDSERLHVDSIIESSGLNAQTVLRLLLELELEGRVTQHPGKLFSLA
jgi:predicted Rossmann fold nucleotide-binding protein DprA/Smf involved in DNA uptake